MTFDLCFQLISLESIMELGRARERRKIQDEMRALALNVFLQGRRLLNHNSSVKSLTGFGTAAAADLFLKSKDVRLLHCHRCQFRNRFMNKKNSSLSPVRVTRRDIKDPRDKIVFSRLVILLQLYIRNGTRHLTGSTHRLMCWHRCERRARLRNHSACPDPRSARYST